MRGLLRRAELEPEEEDELVSDSESEFDDDASPSDGDSSDDPPDDGDESDAEFGCRSASWIIFNFVSLFVFSFFCFLFEYSFFSCFVSSGRKSTETSRGNIL